MLNCIVSNKTASLKLSTLLTPNYVPHMANKAPTDFPADLLIDAAKPEKLTAKSERSCDTE
jgi:hypothetical protein